MDDDLYWQDILAWSQEQATLLRRLAAGERVNDVDWAHVIEEVESVGESELRACRSLLRQGLRHLLKLHGWPEHAARGHWTGEAVMFLLDVQEAFAPSMRQKLDVAGIYQKARLSVTQEMTDGPPACALPGTCPLTLDDLLADPPDIAGLLRKFGEGGA